MTKFDLPANLQVEGVRIYVPGEKVTVHIPEHNIAAIEKDMLPLLERKESA